MDKQAVFGKVSGAAKARLTAVAAYLNISQAEALELILDNVALDANGRPGWYDGPARPHDDQELPLQTAS